jgi:hypothetical protein
MTTARQERTRDFIGSPNAIDLICAHITAGGTLAAFARRGAGSDVLVPIGEEDKEDRSLIFSLVAAWIETDDTRRKRYRSAVEVREQHHKDEIVEQLRNMVVADVLAAFADDGTLKPLSDIPIGVRQWIAGMEVEEVWEGRGEHRAQTGILRKIKFYDKTRNIELLMRNLSMLIDKHQVTAVTLAELLAGDSEKRS